MAFDNDYLNPVGGHTGKAGGLYIYHTLDAVTDVDGAGYFNAAVAYDGAYNVLKVGDVIIVVDWATAIGTGTITDFGILIVNSKSAGTLDTTNAVDLLTTDAD